MSDNIKNIVTDNTVDSFVFGGSNYTRREENSQAIFSKSGQTPAVNSIQSAIQSNSYQEIFFADQYFTRTEKNSQVIYRRTAVSRDAVISISTLSSPTNSTVDLSIQILEAAPSDNWQYNIDGTWSSLFDSSQNSVTINNLSTGQKTIYVRLLHESGGVLSQSDPSTVTVYSFTSSDSGLFVETTKTLNYENSFEFNTWQTDGGNKFLWSVPIYAFDHQFLKSGDLPFFPGSGFYYFDYLFYANISFLNYDSTNNQFLPESERKYITAEIDLSITYWGAFDSMIASGNVSFDTTKSWHQVGQNIYPLDFYDVILDDYAAFALFPDEVQLSDDGQTCVITGGFGHCKIFRYISNKWQEIGEGFDNNTLTVGSPRLSSDGNTLAFCRPNESYNSIDNVGVIRVYTFSSSTQTWTQLGSDIFGTQQDEESGDDFEYGSAFHLSGDGLTIAIGSPKYDTGTSTISQYDTRGRVRVYRYINNDWVQIGSDFFGGENNEQLGVTVFLSNDGNTLAIGSARYTIYANFSATYGHGRILTYSYNESNNTWSQFGGQITGSANSSIGYSMHLSGDGQNISFSDGDTNNRNLKVFRLINNSWTQIGSNVPIVGNNPNTSSQESQDVTQMSDDGTTVYTMTIDSDAGNVDYYGGSEMNLIKIYKYINNDWVQVGNLSTLESSRPVINASGNIIALVFDMYEDDYDGWFEQVQVFRYVEDQASFPFYGIMEQNLENSLASENRFSYLTISNSYFDENIFDGRNFEITLLKNGLTASIRFDAQHRDNDSTKMEFLGITSS